MLKMHNNILIESKRHRGNVSWQTSSQICFFVHTKLISRSKRVNAKKDWHDVCLVFGPQNFRHHRRSRRDRGRCTSSALPRLSRWLLFRCRLSVWTLGEKSFDRRRSERAMKPSAKHLCIPRGSTVTFSFFLFLPKKDARIILMSLLYMSIV